MDGSGVFRSVSPVASAQAQTLSATFWGLDLRKTLPRVLSRDGVEATVGEIGRVREFLIREFPSLTEETFGVVHSAAMLAAKHDYLQSACDLIELRHHNRTVGVIVGAPEDWSSYYIRIFAVIQEYQRPALTRRFVRECLFDPLTESNVERVAADTSPANLAMSRGFSEMHFHVTGHNLSERWGPLVRYTKFLDPACEAAFYKRFTGIASPGSNGRKEEIP